MEENELQNEKKKVINGVTLNAIEISKIAMICDYLVLDRYSDISSFFRFEKCFGPLLSKEDPQLLIDAFKEICGPKRKYINFGRLILAYTKWKSNSSQNENFNQFMKIVFNDMIKTENEVIGELEEGTRIFSTRNTRGRKIISKFGVFTDSQKNTIQGFNIQYDDFFDSLLCSKKKENDDKNITLEMNFLPNGKTILDRDGISHIAGKFSAANKLIKFLIFKCRSGKTFYIGDNRENDDEQIQLFMFGTSSCQLKTLRIETINDRLAYLEPKFQPSMRINAKIIPFDEIDEKYINENILNSILIFEENEIQNIPDENLDEKTLLIPSLNDDAFITDKESLIEPIFGKDINEFYKSYLQRQSQSEDVSNDEEKKLKNKMLEDTVKRIALLKFYIKKFKIKENIKVLKNKNKQEEERIDMDKYLAKIKLFRKKVSKKKIELELEKEKEGQEKVEFDDQMEGFEQDEDWPDDEQKFGKKESVINEEKKEDDKEEDKKEEEKVEIKIEEPEVQKEDEKNIVEENKIEMNNVEEKKEENIKIEDNEKINIDAEDIKEIKIEDDEPEKKRIKLRGKSKKLINKRQVTEKAQDEKEKENKNEGEGEGGKEEIKDKEGEEDKKEEEKNIEIIDENEKENKKVEIEDKKEEEKKIELIDEKEEEKKENKKVEIEDKKEENEDKKDEIEEKKEGVIGIGNEIVEEKKEKIENKIDVIEEKNKEKNINIINEEKGNINISEKETEDIKDDKKEQETNLKNYKNNIIKDENEKEEDDNVGKVGTEAKNKSFCANCGLI